MIKQKLIKKAMCFHSNIKQSDFESMTNKQIIKFLHPEDRKEVDYNSVYDPKYENIYYNPNRELKKRW